MRLFIVTFFLSCSSVFGYHWTLPQSQELFRTLLSNVTECQYQVEEYGYQQRYPGQFPTTPNEKIFSRYGGICAPDVESCIHLGMTPRPILDDFRGPGCEVCCARKPCGTFPGKDGEFRNGYCMLPEILQYNETAFTGFNYTDFTGTYVTGVYVDAGNDRWDQMCMEVGGSVAQASPSINWTIWWDIQCPMSGRCCLYPEPDQCLSCGQKYGRAYNFSRYGNIQGRSDAQDEALAWKTAVHQMAGTGWNLGMQPVLAPGYAEQYSAVPPNYDSLLSPQLWNNGLNLLTGKGGPKKGDNDDDDDDEDDFKGWCWQAALLSKTNGNLRCSGALISDRFVVTTAACVNFTTGGFGDYKIRLGGTDLRKPAEKNAVEFDIAGVFIHPDYDFNGNDNNIAVIELASNVSCNGKYICTICLPSPFIMNFGNITFGSNHEQYIRDDVRQCVATGWGRRNTGGFVSFLKEMPYIPVYNNDSFCETHIRTMKGVQPDYTLPNNSFCAAPQMVSGGKGFQYVSACQGDAGAPLACWYGGRYYLTGLVSTFNTQRCESGKAGSIISKLQPNKNPEGQSLLLDVFTDISQFIPWINRVIYGFF